MTVEEIRAAAERRVAQMKPEEYERYAAQARADLELTETKLFYTLKGEERNRFLRARERLTGTGHRDPKTMSLRELRDRYGDLPENTVYGRKPRVMKTWIFVLLFFVCLTHWIPLSVIAEQSNNPWYDILMMITVIIWLSVPGFLLMIVISAIRNRVVKRRILTNSAAAIDNLRLEDETVRVIADQIRQKREEVAQMQEMREAIETRQKQEADFGSLANGKYSAVDRTNAKQNSANDEAQMINGKYPVILPERKPVSALTEADLNRKLADIIDTNEGSRVFETETPDPERKMRMQIEEISKARFESLSQAEYDAIAAPIRQHYDTLRQIEAESFGIGTDRQQKLRQYELVSQYGEEMLRNARSETKYQPLLDKTGFTVSDLFNGRKNLLKDKICKFAACFGLCVLLLLSIGLMFLRFGSHFGGFESFLSIVTVIVASVAGIVFFVRLLRNVSDNAKLNRAIETCSNPEDRQAEIDNEIRRMVYEREKQLFDSRPYVTERE